MLIELDSDTLQEVVGSNAKVMVQYSASWCGNCRIMKPKFKRMSTENEDVTFVIIDASVIIGTLESPIVQGIGFAFDFR